MKKILFISILVFSFSVAVKAQSQHQCERSLVFATTYFKQKNFRLSSRTLDERCFNVSSMGSVAKVKKAFKIKIESLRELDFDFEADDLYSKFETWARRYNSAGIGYRPFRKYYNDIKID